MSKENKKKETFQSYEEILQKYFPDLYEEEVLARKGPFESGTLLAKKSMERHKHVLSSK